MLLQPPFKVLVLVLGRLEARRLARNAATCLDFYNNKSRLITPMEETLRQRAAARGCMSPAHLPEGATS